MTEMQIIDFNKKNVTTGLSKKGYGHAYFAKRNFIKGEEIIKGFGKKIDHQTSHSSVQVGKDSHYLPTKWTGKYWNHSCEPNSFIKTRPDGFTSSFALKAIKKGEEITYAYSMTEFKWSKNAKEKSVKCLCGKKRCKGKILSFSQLSSKEQKRLLTNETCSKYLLDMVK